VRSVLGFGRERGAVLPSFPRRIERSSLERRAKGEGLPRSGLGRAWRTAAGVSRGGENVRSGGGVGSPRVRALAGRGAPRRRASRSERTFVLAVAEARNRRDYARAFSLLGRRAGEDVGSLWVRLWVGVREKDVGSLWVQLWVGVREIGIAAGRYAGNRYAAGQFAAGPYAGGRLAAGRYAAGRYAGGRRAGERRGLRRAVPVFGQGAGEAGRFGDQAAPARA
jgi:hypothetical protein